MLEALEAIERAWRPLGGVDPTTLLDARLQAHWAVQPIAAAARSAIEPRPGDVHTSMRWFPETDRLVGARTPKGVHLGLVLSELTLLAVDDGGRVTGDLALHGRTLAEALDWASAAIAPRAAETAQQDLAVPDYDLPAHAVGEGEEFRRAGRELVELARWFHNGAVIALTIRALTPGASAVRCWPHHFDIATLVELDPDASDAEQARSIGVGLSPGDDSYAEPYFYVNPWPSPDPGALEPLGGAAHWHTAGWVGAVVPAQPVVAAREEQARVVTEAVGEAFTACNRLLGA